MNTVKAPLELATRIGISVALTLAASSFAFWSALKVLHVFTSSLCSVHFSHLDSCYRFRRNIFDLSVLEGEPQDRISPTINLYKTSRVGQYHTFLRRSSNRALCNEILRPRPPAGR